MPKRNISTAGKEGLSPSSSSATKSVSTATSPSPASDDVAKVYDVINEMVVDGVIKNYALGGAMAAFFYVEPSYTADMDLFCA